jgi:hypothetical protein
VLIRTEQLGIAALGSYAYVNDAPSLTEALPGDDLRTARGLGGWHVVAGGGPDATCANGWSDAE